MKGSANPRGGRAVGRDVLRKEGLEKLNGRALYVADLPSSGALWGLTVRSPHPHARILSCSRDPGFDWGGVTVVTAHDLAAMGCENVVQLIVDDQPFLAREEVRHREEPVALIAAATRERAEEASRHLRIEYQPLPALLDFEKSSTVFKEYRVEKGDAAGALQGAEVVVEGTYRFGHQEQAYLENNGVVAETTPEGGLLVRGSMQCPYYVHKALRRLFRLEGDKVRVVQTVTGGGFGGKEEYPNLIAGHAALLAKASGRPVRILYDRAEDMAATTKRHPGLVRHRTALTREGRLVGMEVELILDGGAYVTLSPVVLSRATLHAAGPYRCDHLTIVSRVVETHTPPNGAFRGFGVPQACFALERHMDVIARRLGVDRAEIRRINALKDGETTATGQSVTDAGATGEALEAALKASHFEKRAKEYAAFNARSRTHRRGIGLASFFHGTGFTGAGELRLQAEAGVELTPQGAVRVLAASTEIGQGTRTAFAQIVADTIGIPYPEVEIADPDTALVPDSGPTVASRTIAIVGGILAEAAGELSRELRSFAGVESWTAKSFRKAARDWLAAGKRPRFLARFTNPAGQVWDDTRYRGDAYGAYAWAAAVAEVEVDLVTCQVKVLRITTAQEIGKAIHPRLAAGQIEGGTIQALGWALMEEVVMKEGRMANGQLTNYLIPTAVESPPITVVMLERPWRHGPFGAKGLGELPMDGGAPALVNAIVDATGVELDRIPATPERILAALVASRDQAQPLEKVSA